MHGGVGEICTSSSLMISVTFEPKALRKRSSNLCDALQIDDALEELDVVGEMEVGVLQDDVGLAHHPQHPALRRPPQARR